MKIFFKTDEKFRVMPCCDWAADIEPDEDWIIGDLEGDAYNDKGIALWKYVGNAIIERTQAEIAEDEAEMPIEPPSGVEQMQADIDFLTMENEYLEGVTEQQQADIDFCLMMLDE